MLLKLKNVKKNYKINKNEVQEVLKDINLTLKSGEFVCIYGESGSGKSTLMNIIGGLDDDYIGTVTINKKDIKKIDKDNYRRDKIGFVFQNFNLIPYLSVFENVMIMLDMTNVKQIKKIKMVESALEKVGLFEYKNKKVTELSGGQKQRVALARAIINEPDIILADEPTGALDSKNADKVLKILKQISNDGKLVIVVTHSNKVKKYSSRVITIEDGLIKKDEILKNIKNVKKRNKSLKRNLNSFMCVKLGLSNIIKNLKRNILLITASSIGVIGILISLYIGSGVKKYISNELKNNANPLLFTVSEKGKNELYDVKYYSKSEIDKIRKIDHVTNIKKDISYTSAYIVYNGKKYDLVSLSSNSNIKDKNIKLGNVPKTNEIVISEYLSDNILNKRQNDLVGKNIKLYLLDSSKTSPALLTKNLEISGIYKNGKVNLINNSNYAYVTYNTLEEIYSELDEELKPTEIKIEIDKKENIEYVKKRMKKMGFELSNMEEYTNAIFNYLDIATYVLSSFSFLSLIVSCIMMIIVFSINVLERTKEIGILRSLGFRKKDIKQIFKTEAILIGIFTGIFSCIISKILSSLINSVTKSKFDISIVNANLKYMIFGIILSILICIIGNIIPSRKASRLNIIDALRYE